MITSARTCYDAVTGEILAEPGEPLPLALAPIAIAEDMAITLARRRAEYSGGHVSRLVRRILRDCRAFAFACALLAIACSSQALARGRDYAKSAASSARKAAVRSDAGSSRKNKSSKAGGDSWGSDWGASKRTRRSKASDW